MTPSRQRVQWLVDSESFRDWVYRPAEPGAPGWNDWRADDPLWQEAIEQARTILLDIRGDLPKLSDERIEERVKQVLATAEVRPLVWRSQRRWSAWRWAAVLFPILVTTAWWWSRPPHPVPVETGGGLPVPAGEAATAWRTRTNQTDKPQRIVLPDRSAVRLQPGSRMAYPASFTRTQRLVHLVGEAFFEVKHDPTRPFWVYAPGVHTRVLGTSFTVQAYEGARQATVTVQTGRVSVYGTDDQTGQEEKRSVVLTPNQQAVLSRTDNRLFRTLIEEPQPVLPAEATNVFVFQRTPLPVVLKKLEAVYGVPLLYDERTLQTCTLTATLGQESLWEKLKWICAGTGSTYEVIDGQIVLSSPGCSRPSAEPSNP